VRYDRDPGAFLLGRGGRRNGDLRRRRGLGRVEDREVRRRVELVPAGPGQGGDEADQSGGPDGDGRVPALDLLVLDLAAWLLRQHAGQTWVSALHGRTGHHKGGAAETGPRSTSLRPVAWRGDTRVEADRTGESVNSLGLFGGSCDDSGPVQRLAQEPESHVVARNFMDTAPQFFDCLVRTVHLEHHQTQSNVRQTPVWGQFSGNFKLLSSFTKLLFHCEYHAQLQMKTFRAREPGDSNLINLQCKVGILVIDAKSD